jgi:hypothetical protein
LIGFPDGSPEKEWALEDVFESEPGLWTRCTDYAYTIFNTGFRPMSVVEKISERVQQLPERRQAEVLDFVESLVAKTEREQARREEREWSRQSLSAAMRGMEDENGPEYTAEDLEECFSSS